MKCKHNTIIKKATQKQDSIEHDVYYACVHCGQIMDVVEHGSIS